MRSIVLALLISCSTASIAAAQPEPAALRTSLDRLQQALQQQDVAPLLPALDPGFRAAGFTGDMALSIIRQVIASGKIAADAIEVTSVSPSGENFKVVAWYK
jgi:hypothetical protein